MRKNTLITLIIAISLASCTNSENTNIITIDTHDDINVANFTDSLNYTMNTKTQVNLPKMIDGPFKGFYPNGQMADEGNMKKGFKNGLWKIYNMDGSLSKKTLYKNGEILRTKDY